MAFLYEKMDVLREAGAGMRYRHTYSRTSIQTLSFALIRKKPSRISLPILKGICARILQTLFHMATGSGKTLIMAARLCLYKQDTGTFCSFVNLSNIVKRQR